MNLSDTPLGFVQEDRDAEILGFAMLENAEEVFQGHAGIEDVFDHDHVLTFDAGIEVAG